MTSWQVCRRACRHPQSSCVIFCQLYNIEQLPQKLLVSLLPVTKPQVSVCSDILATDDWKDMKYIWIRAGGTVQPAWPRPDRQNTERYDAVCFSYWSFSYRNTNVTHDNEMKGIVGAVVIMRIGRYGAVWASLQHREREGGLAGGNCFLLNTEYWKINFFHLLRIMHIFVSEKKKCFLRARRLLTAQQNGNVNICNRSLSPEQVLTGPCDEPVLSTTVSTCSES